MEPIRDVTALEALYGEAAPASTRKVTDHLTEDYGTWIARSRFCVLSTVGPAGTDASPRGDQGPVATALDPKTLALPDWRGNNRLDSLRNIVEDGRVSLMFMVPGSMNVIRVNGRGVVTADPATCARFAIDGKLPRTVIVVTIGEVYFQCGRALVRSRLWSGEDESVGLAQPGEILANLTEGAEGGPDYDAAWPARAAKTLW